MKLDLESAVHEWILEHPQSQPLFEELGIDTSCGGKSLEYACLQRGLDPPTVLARLREFIEQEGTR